MKRNQMIALWKLILIHILICSSIISDMMVLLIFIKTFECFIFFEINIKIDIFYNHRSEVFEYEEEEENR